jgi:hypothetical protein
MSTAQHENGGKGYSHDLDKHYLVLVNQEYKCVCEMCSCGTTPIMKANIAVPDPLSRVNSRPATIRITRIRI